jgi:hypothetical protein
MLIDGAAAVLAGVPAGLATAAGWVAAAATVVGVAMGAVGGADVGGVGWEPGPQADRASGRAPSRAARARGRRSVCLISNTATVAAAM